MQEPRELSKEQLDELYYGEFKNGRPMDFLSDSAPGGVSLIVLFSDWFKKLGLIEKTPDWVRKSCGDFRQRKIEDGTLRRKEWSGNQFDLSDASFGTFIRAKSRSGHKRIAVLLGEYPQSFLVAAWDGETGEEIPFPV